MDVGDDGVVVGRQERAGDPAIPERLRKELTSSTAPEGAEDARIALGEAGEPWWEPTPDGRRARLAATMRALLRHRRPEATICPSDAARVVGGESWRDLMDEAREVAADLSRQGIITVRQHGADVDLSTAVGPIRLARGPRW